VVALREYRLFHFVRFVEMLNSKKDSDFIINR